MSWRSATASSPATCSAISSMRNIKPIRCASWREKYEIPTAQTVAIGDGANDLPMIKAAGLGIAYHAKPKVNEQAEVTIRHADLMGVFCILSGSMNQK